MPTKRKQGTFTSEITEMLAYYYAVAKRSEPPKMEKRAARQPCTDAVPPPVSAKASVARAR